MGAAEITALCTGITGIVGAVAALIVSAHTRGQSGATLAATIHANSTATTALVNSIQAHSRLNAMGAPSAMPDEPTEPKT